MYVCISVQVELKKNQTFKHIILHHAFPSKSVVESTWLGSLVIIAVMGDDAKCIIVVYKKLEGKIN